MSQDAEQAPKFRNVKFPPVDLEIEKRPDGVLVMTPRASLEFDSPTVIEGFNAGAEISPEKIALAERGADGEWSTKTFQGLKSDVHSVAQWLLDNGGGPDTPVMFISGNSIAHATVRYGALAIGAPIAPVSENYALLGAKSGFEKLEYAISLIRPRFIFAETSAFADAVRACAGDAVVISAQPDAVPGAAAYVEIINTKVSDDVVAASARIDPDAPAAFMLTSGSTGRPKAVIHTNRMMRACVAQSWWAMKDTGAWDNMILEWLPWSHVSGLYVSIAAALVGGSYYIDGGRPLPGRFDQTLENIRDLSLNYYTSVPAGYSMLADALEQDAALRDHFFKNMRLMLFGGAALPQPLYDRLQALAIASVGERILITSGYGATETTSGCMSIYFPTETVGIGLPLPGLSLKLLPHQGRFEVRMKGCHITPGYLGRDDFKETSLDDEGFYRTGDTAEFIDAHVPEHGLRFAGRLSEEFKLNTGTWVAGGALRVSLLKALGPEVMEMLICGENRDRIGILAWMSPRAGEGALEMVRRKIESYNQTNSTSSTRVRRFGILVTPPDSERGELSEKGSVNQALAIRRRTAEVDALYADPPPNGLLTFD